MVERLRPSPRVPPMHELSDAQARRLGGLLCYHGHRPASEVWGCPLCRRWVLTGSTHWLAAAPPGHGSQARQDSPGRDTA